MITPIMPYQESMILVNAKEIPEKKVLQFRKDFIAAGETSINGSRGLHNYNVYADWIWLVKECEKPDNKLLGVQASTYFAVSETDDRIVGCIELRHTLNENLATMGGHIGIEKVLLTCDMDNVASSKTIISKHLLAANKILLEKRRIYFKKDNCIINIL